MKLNSESWTSLHRFDGIDVGRNEHANPQQEALDQRQGTRVVFHFHNADEPSQKKTGEEKKQCSLKHLFESYEKKWDI